LKSKNCCGLESELGVNRLGNITKEALEGSFLDEKFTGFLIPLDLAKGDGTRPEPSPEFQRSLRRTLLSFRTSMTSGRRYVLPNLALLVPRKRRPLWGSHHLTSLWRSSLCLSILRRSSTCVLALSDLLDSGHVLCEFLWSL
jgi:hypothetical protein